MPLKDKLLQEAMEEAGVTLDSSAIKVIKKYNAKLVEEIDHICNEIATSAQYSLTNKKAEIAYRTARYCRRNILDMFR